MLRPQLILWVALLPGVTFADPTPPVQNRPLPPLPSLPPPPPPRQPLGPSVLSPNVSAVRGSDDFRLDRPPTVWNQIQPDLDRSNGYIRDESTFQLDQLDLLRSHRFDNDEARRTYELFRAERERQLRLDQRQLDLRRRARQSEAQQREEAMRLKEYELYLNAGLFNAAGAQAEADRNALQAAKNTRDEQLAQATKERDAAMAKLAPNDQARQDVTRHFEARRGQIEQAYQKERSRILGFN